MKKTIILMGTLLGLNALAECKDFSGVYQQAEYVMTVKQADCTKIDVTVSNTYGIAKYLSVIPFSQNVTTTGIRTHIMITDFIDADMFGWYSVDYDYSANNTLTSSDIYRLNDEGDLIEIFSNIADKFSTDSATSTVWKRTQSLK